MTHRIHRIALTAAFSALLLAAAPAMAAGAATVATATKAPYGTYLVGAKGMSLYMFQSDKQGSGKSTCYGNCAKTWPPLLTEGKVKASGKADSDKLGTIKRKDGKKQVTYNGWPLYYFISDQSAGDTTGQNVGPSGKKWYLLDPQGKVIHSDK